MIRVLLVDDQELVRSGFRIILDSEPGIKVVGEAANGIEAFKLAAETEPDVICMDVEMPELNGIEATRRILAGSGRMPSVLILTTFGHETYLFDALAAGASGFLLKTSRAEQLIDAVRTLASGGALLGPDVTRAVIERVSHERKTNEAVLPTNLTGREQEVLEQLSLGKSNGEIAEALFLGEATVKTHVSNLLQKLGVRDRIQAIVWAHTHGRNL